MAQNNAINNRSSTLTVDNAFTVTTGTVSIDSGTSAINISSDASATTVNIGTGGAAKTVTFGSTNSSSSLALQYGTSDMTLASASGTVMSALDTGEIREPLNVACLEAGTTFENDVTGDGTNYTTAGWDTEIYDQGSDFSSNTFTAPVTGKYLLGTNSIIGGVASGHDNSAFTITTSNRAYVQGQLNPGAAVGDPSGAAQTNANVEALADMDAADTAVIKVLVAGSTKTVDIIFFGSRMIFYSYLVA